MHRPHLRTPSLPVEELTRIIGELLAQLNLPPAEYGALSIGSVAEGFGNAYSDLDFLVFCEDAGAIPRMRQMSVVGKWRCEVLFRSSDALRLFAERMHRYSPDSLERRPDPKDLDFYHRVCFGWPLLQHEMVERVVSCFDPAYLPPVLTAIRTADARTSWLEGGVLLRLGHRDHAVLSARRSLRLAMSAWTAARGETYDSDKFLPRQLRRAGVDSAEASALCSDMSPAPGEEPGTFLERCHHALGRWGLTLPATAPFTASAAEGVSSWAIGESTYLLRDRTNLFKLSAEAVAVWTRLAEAPVSLPGALEAEPGDQLPEILGQLYLHGFVRIGVGDELRRMAACNTLVRPSRVLIGPTGFEVASNEAAHVEWVSASAPTAVGAAAQLLEAGLYLENTREDAAGAIEAREWGQLAFALAGMVSGACDLILSAHGISPLPQDYRPELAVRGLEGYAEVGALAESVVFARIENERDAQAVYPKVEAVLAAVPAFAVHPDVERCHQSGLAWTRFFLMAGQWALLAQHLEMELPVDAAQTLLAVGQGTQTPLMKPEVFAEILGWRRPVDLASSIRALGGDPQGT